MRLLITTQAVDLDDPVLSFFHRWLEEFAKHYESIHVICLKEGRHHLPANVQVHSLGKEKGHSRTRYIFNFYRYIWRLRREYASVFVHMNSEYVVLGGVFWRLWGKRVVLWRNHKIEGFSTSVAARIAHVVCYTSPSAFVAKFKNAVQMPIGIDTNFFSSGAEAPKHNSILFLGRLDPVKNVDVFVRALGQLHEQGIDFFADIVGDPTDPRSKYAHDVRNIAAPLVYEGVAAMHRAVSNDAARDLYRSHAIYVNLTPSGSFDKTIGEAMACGCVCVVANEALRGILPDTSIAQAEDLVSVANCIRSALSMADNDRAAHALSARAYVAREQSLSLLAQRIAGIL